VSARRQLSVVALVALAATLVATGARAEPDGGAPPPASGASADVEVRVAVSPTEGLMTGDAVTLDITVVARSGDDVAVPKQSFLPFEVRAKNARTEDAGDGRARHVFELELLAFEPGIHTLGPVQVRVVSPGGSIDTVETDSVTVTVGSLIANEPNAEPKPPTEPVTVMQDDPTLLWLGGSLLALALVVLLTLLIARWWNRRRAAAKPPPPPRPAHEVALEQLARLRLDRPRAETEGRLVEWVDGVSDTLRQYLGGRFRFEGLESTTDEVLAHLRRVALSETLRTEVAAILGECDLIKFARVSPEPARCDELLEGASRVVHRTQPMAQAPSPAPAPAPEVRA
jgi:hypothetical protein